MRWGGVVEVVFGGSLSSGASVCFFSDFVFASKQNERLSVSGGIRLHFFAKEAAYDKILFYFAVAQRAPSKHHDGRLCCSF